MGDTEHRHFPRPQDHSLKVYSAILGQKPTVAPDGKMIVHPPGAGFWQKAGLRWADVRRMVARGELSPAVRARLLPLLAEARKRWREACGRFAVPPPARLKPIAKTAPVNSQPALSDRKWRPRRNGSNGSWGETHSRPLGHSPVPAGKTS